jgi:hypothetical protein
VTKTTAPKSVHLQAFALRISKDGSTPSWYAPGDSGGVRYMACLANAALYSLHNDAAVKAEELRHHGIDVEIVPVSAQAAS